MNSPTQSSATSSYSKLKTELLGCMDEMLGIDNIRGCACEDLKEKVRSNAFNLVVVGQFKRGKTSLINALLGAEILPVAVVPLTSIVTIMTWGEVPRIKVYFNDERVSEIKPESLSEYVTEKATRRTSRTCGKWSLRIHLLISEREGCSVDAITAAKIHVRNAADGLDLLLNPKRIKATLRF
jgi:hypothetical protein